MKKLFVVLGVIALMFAMVLPVSAATHDISVVDVTELVYAGDTVIYTVSISEDVTVGSAGVEVTFDSNVLAIDMALSGWLVDGTALDNFEESGKGAIAFSGEGVISGDVIVIAFNVIEGATIGETTISFDLILKELSETCTTTTTLTVACHHEFSNEVATDTYIKTPATCAAAAVYFKSCACGEKGTETFSYGDKLPHNPSADWKNDDENHWHVCTNGCNEKTDVTAHDWTEVVDDKYLKSAANCTDAAVYKKVCGTCEYISNTETFTSGDALGHNFDTNVWESNSVGHYHPCLNDGCDYRGTENGYEKHSSTGDNAATCSDRAVCDVCGKKYGDTPEHAFGEWEISSDSFHAHICEVCEEEEFAEHTWDNGVVTTVPTETAEGVKTFTCVDCGMTKTESVPVSTHTHSFGTEWHSDAANHWNVCACGEKGNVAAHTFTEAVTKQPACEAEGEKTLTCSVCGYAKTEAIAAIGHAYDNGKVTTAATCEAEGVKTFTCANCGDTYTEAVVAIGHAWDNGKITTEPTEDAEGVKTYTCANCNETKTKSVAKLDHTHAYGDEWKKDETSHWHECECGEVADKAAHSWNDGVVTTEPTETAEGTKTYTCADCGATKTESVPATGVVEPEPAGFNHLWIGIIVIIVIILAGVIVIIVLKKKNEEEEK